MLAVLLVDSYRTRRESLAADLGVRGFEVRTAVNPRGAVAVVRKHAIDLVLVSDIDPGRVVRPVRIAWPRARFIAIAQSLELNNWIELGLLGVLEVIGRDATGDEVARVLGRFVADNAA